MPKGGKYYVNDAGVLSGPHTLDALRKLLAKRDNFDQRLQVRRDDEVAWRPVARVPELIDLLLAPAPHSTLPASPRAKRRAS